MGDVDMTSPDSPLPAPHRAVTQHQEDESLESFLQEMLLTADGIASPTHSSPRPAASVPGTPNPPEEYYRSSSDLETNGVRSINIHNEVYCGSKEEEWKASLISHGASVIAFGIGAWVLFQVLRLFRHEAAPAGVDLPLSLDETDLHEEEEEEDDPFSNIDWTFFFRVGLQSIMLFSMIGRQLVPKHI